RVHVLHVDGATAPDHAVHLVAAERVHLPVRRLRGHDVGVAVHDERRAGGVLTRDAQQHGAAARAGLHVGGVVAHLGQQLDDLLGDLALPGSGVVPVVGGVDPAQLAADPDGVGARVDRGGGHREVSIVVGCVRWPWRSIDSTYLASTSTSTLTSSPGRRTPSVVSCRVVGTRLTANVVSSRAETVSETPSSAIEPLCTT